MSELESTDLLCEARRRELSEREQRRLEELLSRDLGARLMQLMQPELERSSRVQPGDDVLATRIAEHALALADLGPVRSRLHLDREDLDRENLVRKRDSNWASAVVRRGRGPLWLLAAAIMFGATGAAAWWATHSSVVETVNSSSEESGEVAGVRRISKALNQRRSRESESESVPLPERVLTPESVPSSTELGAPEPAPREAMTADASPVSRRDSARVPSTLLTAAQLFADANLLRREGHSAQAIRLYRNILSDYPKTREASLSRLVLAKTLAGSNPRQSLAYYQVVARTNGSLRAEALWGVVEAATQLKQVGI
ncbi:MAG TPA: hypothetical protein VKP30_27465, partial [Polyangiaceae bacterium]|nr:hypothetical protein [Polyangiaceae bacterium]